MARSRKTDPYTSHQAAAEAESSGRASGHRRICLSAVIEKPGRTAAEVAAETNLERHVPSRRLPELRSAGRVYNGEVRVCLVTGRNSMTWYPSKKETR